MGTKKEVPHAWAIGVNQEGKIMYNFQELNKKLPGITSAIEHNGYLYLGNLKSKYIVRALWFSAFPEPSSSGLTRGSTAITDYGYPAFAEYDDKEKHRKPK